MKIAMFDTHHFEREFFEKAKATGCTAKHDVSFFETVLNANTAPLATGFDCVCCFVNDRLDAETLGHLKRLGVRLVALRSAGYNNVNLEAADQNNIPVVRVPAYSPHAVAEHATGLLLALNRKIHRAYTRVREQNFSLEGLMGFDLYNKTVGVIGTGNIGSIFAVIMAGFGCRVLAHDPVQNPRLADNAKIRYVPLPQLYGESDIISLHVPLLPETHHMINVATLAQMKKGVILINTGRGALIDSKALIEALKSGHLGGAGLDVYEEEEGIFFKDLSDQVLKDDTLARLLTFPNVLMTSHQGFLTREALQNIATVTFQNIDDFEAGRKLLNQVHVKTHVKNDLPSRTN